MNITYTFEKEKFKKEIGGSIKQFAFDGCHKIYLIENEDNLKNAIDGGYNTYPIEDLQEKFEHSCGLKFINTWDLETIVPQFAENVEFEKGV